MLRKDNSNLEAVELRRMLGDCCPACQRALNKHAYALIGRTVASRDNTQRLNEFFDGLKSHDWQKVKEFREFDGGFNTAEAYALKCISGSMVLLGVRDPVELFESSSVVHIEILTEKSASDLDLSIERSKWRLV
jgi:hypothetical protein